jgi:hypothetical protein
MLSPRNAIRCGGASNAQWHTFPDFFALTVISLIIAAAEIALADVSLNEQDQAMTVWVDLRQEAILAELKRRRRRTGSNASIAWGFGSVPDCGCPKAVHHPKVACLTDL